MAGGKQEMPPTATRLTNKDSERQPFNRPAANYMRQHSSELGLPDKDVACLQRLLTKAGTQDHVCVESSNDDGSLAAMPERLRTTLCWDLYRVAKMVHCEAQLLLHLCKTHDIQKPETLAAYVLSSGVTDHGKMMADLAESNPQAAREDVERAVVKLVHGAPLREALAGRFSTSTPDLKWLPQMEEEIKKAHLQLSDKLRDTAMQVEPESGSFYPEEEDEGYDVEGANFMQELETGVAAVDIEARDERNARAKEAATIVSQMLGDLQGRCLEALYQYLRKTGAIHTRGDGEHVGLVNSIMIRNTKKHRGLITMDFLSKASTTIEKTTGFKPTIEIKAFRVCDGYSLPDEFNAKVERGQNLIRELALQGQLLDADDANNVIDLVIQILAAESFGEQAETLFYAVVAEWLQRSGKEEFEIEWTISGWITDIANARETLQPAAAASARSALHVRRKQTPLIAFKSARIQVSHQDASSVLDLLQNVDTQGTGARGLVLVCRLLWPPQVAEVHAFIKHNYSGEQSDGLHDDDSFDRVWKTPVTDNAKYALESALSERIQIAVESHPFIHSCLPAIMGQPVASYTKHSRELLFTLDFMPKTVEYRLDYTTGEITSSEGLGVLHRLNTNVRALVLQTRGVQGLAGLLWDAEISDKIRYDACAEAWKVCVASTGLWRLAEKEEAITVVSKFLRSLLEPIKHMAELVGSDTFDCLRGTYAPVVDDDSGGEDVDSGGESGETPTGPGRKRPSTTRDKQAGKKAKGATPQWTGPRSLQAVNDMMRKFVETPKDTAEVLRSLQTTLKTPFAVRPEHLNLFQSAKRLVQLPVSVLMHSPRQRLTATGGHVKSMESEMWLVDAYRWCLGGRAPTKGGAGTHPSSALQDLVALNGAVDTAGTHPSSALQDLVALNGALRFAEDHVTEDLSPVDQMHTALVRNLGPCADWHLVVGWTCLLVVYQAQVKTNTEAEESDRQGKRTAGGVVELPDADAVMPDADAEVLEDCWKRIQALHQGHQNAPTEQEFREAWKQTHVRIMECEQRMLIGGALWSVCFDHLFSYQTRKTRFEQTTFKVKDLMAYFAVSSEGTAIQYPAAALASFHKSLFYWGIAGPKDQEIEVSESGCYTLQNELEIPRLRKFALINRWLQDPAARAFDRIDSIPPNREGSVVPTNVYNTWPGFRAETLPPVPDAEVAGLVQPILTHLRVLLGRSEYFDYLLAWLAQTVQDPSEPTHVAIVLQGPQGIGKDIVFEDFFIKKVLGAGTAFKTSKPQVDIFGAHSVALQNRVFLLFDEVSGDDIRPLMPRLKDLITSSTAHVNPKNQTAYDVRNLSNILGTTNSQNPIHIEPQERRFVVIDCNASRKGDVAYFTSLGAHLERHDVARAFFQHLRDHVDVRPHTPFQAHRPQTDAYLTMQQRSIPLLYKFLSAEIEHATGAANEKRAGVGGKTLFDKFIAWGREGNYSTIAYTISRFGTELGQLAKELTDKEPSQDTLVKGRAGGGVVYTLNWAQLRAHLQDTARYDPNAAT